MNKLKTWIFNKIFKKDICKILNDKETQIENLKNQIKYLNLELKLMKGKINVKK